MAHADATSKHGMIHLLVPQQYFLNLMVQRMACRGRAGLKIAMGQQGCGQASGHRLASIGYLVVLPRCDGAMHGCR